MENKNPKVNRRIADFLRELSSLTRDTGIIIEEGTELCDECFSNVRVGRFEWNSDKQEYEFKEIQQ